MNGTESVTEGISRKSSIIVPEVMPYPRTAGFVFLLLTIYDYASRVCAYAVFNASSRIRL
jgi:hypothetical protein